MKYTKHVFFKDKAMLKSLYVLRLCHLSLSFIVWSINDEPVFVLCPNETAVCVCVLDCNCEPI